MISVQIFALVCMCALTAHSEASVDVGDGYYQSGAPGNDVDVTVTPPNPPEPSGQGRRKRNSNSCTSTSLTETQQTAIVDFHNARRSSVENSEGASGMMKMTWDDGLAGPAQDWANQCNWYHGKTHSCNSGSAGQNMALRTGSVSLEGDMWAWFNEKSYYDYQYNNCSYVCGHYTQMVWDSSNKIGCGINVCSSIQVSATSTWTNAVLLVCNYASPGNWGGQKPYDLGSRCSRCKDLWKSARDPFTCTSDHLCGVGTVISDATCLYQCVNGVRSSTDCFCECSDGFCGASCETAYSCVHGSTTGEFGCGCECDEGYCGLTCDTALPSCVNGTRSGQNGCGCVCNEGYCGTSCDKQWVSQSVDLSPHCAYWQGLGYCTGYYQAFMEQNCAATCGVTIKVCGE